MARKRKRKSVPRPGSGRTPWGKTKKPMTLSLDVRVAAFLDTTANKTRFVEDAVAATEAYQRWRLAGHIIDLPDGYVLPPEGD